MKFKEKLKIAYNLLTGKYNHSVFIYMTKDELRKLVSEEDSEVDIEYRGMLKKHVYQVLQDSYKSISVSQHLEAQREWEKVVDRMKTKYP